MSSEERQEGLHSTESHNPIRSRRVIRSVEYFVRRAQGHVWHVDLNSHQGASGSLSHEDPVQLASRQFMKMRCRHLHNLC